MKKLSRAEINKLALNGTKVSRVKNIATIEQDLRSSLAQFETQHDRDFQVLADSIDRTSSAVEKVYHELKEIRTVKEGAVELEIHRGVDRLIRNIDITKRTQDGKVRHLKASFSRDGKGDVSKIIIAPGS